MIKPKYMYAKRNSEGKMEFKKREELSFGAAIMRRNIERTISREYFLTKHSIRVKNNRRNK